LDWNAIGAIGELLGSVGVLITLVYLAMQIKQNTSSLEENRKYAKAQMYQARANAVNYMSAEFSDPEVWAKLVGDDGIDFEKIQELTTVEQMKIRQFAQALDTHCDNVYQQRELGLLDVSDADLNADDTLRIIHEISLHTHLKLRPSTAQAINERGINT